MRQRSGGSTWVWLIVCVACVLGGFFAGSLRQRPPEKVAAPPPAVPSIPSSGNVHLATQDNTSIAIDITRSASDPTAVSVACMDTPSGTVRVTYRPGVGFPAQVSVSIPTGDSRSWNLRQDGSVEYTSVCTYNQETTELHGVNTYYDSGGAVERTEKFVAPMKTRPPKAVSGH
jgi:hypothetical protein